MFNFTRDTIETFNELLASFIASQSHDHSNDSIAIMSSSISTRTTLTALLGLALSVPLLLEIPRIMYKFRRRAQLPPDYERVLILGASSGIGRAIAHLYAARGARVCLVGRRPDQLREGHEECVALSAKHGHSEYQAGGKRVISVEADYTNVEDMVRVRDTLETEWRGLDTMLVIAGVSALQPLMSIAGVERVGAKAFVPPQAGTEDIIRVVEVALKATAGNFIGPLIAAVTMVSRLSPVLTQ
jgi:hypothetical protein